MTETPKCPYCGAETRLNESNEGIYWYECRECNATGPTEKTPVEAFSAALHRAEPDKIYQIFTIDGLLAAADKIYQQHSKALCGNGNATLDEMLEAAEQIKQRAEPEMRPLTLDEVKTRCKRTLEAEPLFLEFKRGWKSYRLWPRKPTPEQMAAEKWEE